jgi:hypothetical protein
MMHYPRGSGGMVLVNLASRTTKAVPHQRHQEAQPHADDFAQPKAPLWWRQYCGRH